MYNENLKRDSSDIFNAQFNFAKKNKKKMMLFVAKRFNAKIAKK